MAVQVRFRLSGAYTWRSPDGGQLARSVREQLLPFVGADATVSFSTETRPPGYSKSFDSLDEWTADLSSSLESAYAYFRKNENSISLNLYPIRSSFSIDIITSPGREAEAGAFLEAFIKPLGLEEGRRDDSSVVRLEGTYRVTGFEKTALLATLDQLVRDFGNIVDFGGEVRMLAASERRYSFRSLDQWKSRIVNDWKEVAGASYWLRLASGSANISYQKDQQQLRLSLEAPETAKLDSVFSSFVQSLNATPVRDGGNSVMKGERRRYFPETKLDTDWLQQCLSIMTSWNTGQTSFQGRIRTLSQELSTRDFKEWKNQIIAQWKEIYTIYGWSSSFELSQTLDVDLVREIISLEIQGRTTDLVNSNFSAFESALKLKRFYGNPYQYRKFARAYKIEEWKTNDAVADATTGAIAIAFGDKPPAINSAFVTVGTKAEDLQPFATIPDFIARLRKGDYATARLTLEGPRGIGLGISVDHARLRLSIRSSLGRPEFDKVIRTFEELIDLKLDAIEDDPERSTKESNRSSSAAMWVTVVVAILTSLTSLAVAFFTSASGLPSLKTTLLITGPKTDKDVGEIIGLNVPFQWIITKKTLFSGEEPEIRDATITVQEEGSGGYTQQYPAQHTGAQITFPKPGAYQVTIKAESEPAAQPQTIKLNIKEASRPFTSKPPK